MKWNLNIWFVLILFELNAADVCGAASNKVMRADDDLVRDADVLVETKKRCDEFTTDGTPHPQRSPILLGNANDEKKNVMEQADDGDDVMRTILCDDDNQNEANMQNDQPGEKNSARPQQQLQQQQQQYYQGNVRRQPLQQPPTSIHQNSYQHPQSPNREEFNVEYTKEVIIKQGRLKGMVRRMHTQSGLKNVDQYLGIPYAAAPVGNGRFMPPGTYNTLEYCFFFFSSLSLFAYIKAFVCL